VAYVVFGLRQTAGNVCDAGMNVIKHTFL